MILTWGSLNVSATPYMVEFGLDPGAPANEAVALPFLLQDGEVEISSRAGNRTLTFNVLIEGASLTVLAAAEAALLAESEKVLNTITVDPEGGAPVAVYEVFRGQVALVRDDDYERSLLRRYTVTVRAYPFVRSATELTSIALAATGTTTTLLDACSATTGWTGTVDGGAVTPATAGGAVTLTATITRDVDHEFMLQKTFAATTTSTKLLIIDWLPPAGAQYGILSATGDGVSLPLIAEGPSPTSGYTRTWFRVAAASLAVTRIFWTGAVVGGSLISPTLSAVFSLDNVAVSDVNPVIGTGRQSLRALTVSGSARAQGSLAIEASTNGLGSDTLVYVYPADATTTGYSPPQRQFRFSGNTVTGDAAQVSGSTEPLNANPVAFRTPVGLLPAGQYLLMGRIASASSTNATITYALQTSIGGASFGIVNGSTVLATTSAYQVFALARLSLPTVDFDPTAALAGAYAQISITASTAVAITYDEFWLFNTTIGQLTWVDCGTGTGSAGGPSRRLFIEPPTLFSPRPTVRRGHSADRSDSFYFQPKAWQSPQIVPPQVKVFVACTGATDAAASLRYFPRWHTNPSS